MAKKKALKRIAPAKVNIFKIRNRRGYAVICMGRLTEGGSPLLAYSRMIKALKRTGYALTPVTSSGAKRRVRSG